MSTKLKEFKVTKLFGTFNHTITFNTEKGVTIVIGENGLGKTIMLEMINSFFNKAFYYWSNILFEEAKIKFEDGENWIITCKDDSKKGRLMQIQPSKGKPLTISLDIDMRKTRGMPLHHRLPFIERVSSDQYVDNRIGDVIDRETLYRRYSDRYHGRYDTTLFDDEINNGHCCLNIV